MPSETPKTLTVAEANALLPQVKPLVEQLQGLQRAILRTNHELEEVVRKLSAGNGHPIETLKAQVNDLTQRELQLVEELQSALKQLEEIGCWLKDLDLGLADFYGLRRGETIFLCWKLGEARIQFWHALEDGYAGRQPLE